jgi:hypothetical protein
MFKKLRYLFQDIPKQKEEVFKLVEDFRKEVKGVEDKLPPKLKKECDCFNGMIKISYFNNGLIHTRVSDEWIEKFSSMSLEEAIIYASGFVSGVRFEITHNINGEKVTNWDLANSFLQLIRCAILSIENKIQDKNKENNNQLELPLKEE